ncbi:Glu-tRNA(Gln) amidotransferase subunit GatE [Candidatus Micrarchaeota archaeon]|nr:Glu-tRNA(Gln) amidotransferase subunit GatE [Candidatus Micrarchaeota archaeon]
MKIGIEIHSRLLSDKLFCNCPSTLTEDQSPEIKIERMLHPVLSELGESDRTGIAEFKKGKTFEYWAYRNCNCLVETDEEPPHPLNSDALKIVLQIAMQLNATPVDEVQIMRKMVIDGSNTSGFQRTSLIALNGHIESSKGTINIPMIALEEESSGIVSSSENRAVYRLDRLGIPLVEISTSPDIKDGAHLVEVAEKIGLILRATGKVARGLGTIRQDVNVSTEGGSRVEIKGAQDLKMLPPLVDIEVKRQLELVKILVELRERKALPIKSEVVDVTKILHSANSPLIINGLKAGAVVLAQKLPLHKGILGREIAPGKRYGTELSDYAKRAGVKGLIHSDENLDKYSFSETEITQLRSILDLSDADAFVMVVAPAEQAQKALSYVIERANMDHVPEETRRANPDGTSTFMRPLPGRARLYPETDIPPTRLTQEFLQSLDRGESLEDKKAKLEKLLNPDLAKTMLRSRNLHLFEKLVELGADPMMAATTLENTLVSLRRDGIEFNDLEKTLKDLFGEYKKGSFVKAAIPDVLKGMAKGSPASTVLKVFRLQKITGIELEKLVAKEQCNQAAIMQKYRLQVDPQEVTELIAKLKCENPDYR